MNGQHAIIESYGMLSQLSESELLTLMSAAALATGATIVGSHIHSFGENCGSTGVLLLAESHITAHQWPECSYTAFDIFMCGDAAITKAIDAIKHADSKGVHSVQIIKRGAKKSSPLMPSIIADTFVKDAPLIIGKLNNLKSLAGRQPEEALIETIKFLSLCATSKNALTPSKVIDDIWHELILFTRTYHDMCYQYFGRFIHHQPSDNRPQEAEQFQQTLMLYQNTFGMPNDFFWHNQSYVVCGTCENE